MKALVIIPADAVRPDEPRWWCEDGETPETIDRLAVSPGMLHEGSREECGCEGVRYAVVIREVALVDAAVPSEPDDEPSERDLERYYDAERCSELREHHGGRP